MPAGRTSATPARRATLSRPVITLTSDFGLSDSYVAVMKAVLIRHAPEARLIDVSHTVPPQDVLCGSITLERAIDGFPPGTVHLAVVDPGVGSDRRLLVGRIKNQTIVCPDNGLITWTWRRHDGERTGTTFELIWRPGQSSDTFHGRDVMAPVAGMLAAGEPIDRLARPIDDPVMLDIAPADEGASAGRVIHIDHFGNATTNIPSAVLRDRPQLRVRVNRRLIGRPKRTYGDVAPGRALALIGSSGLLEVAVRDGSAAERLRVKVGDRVTLSDGARR